MKLASRLRNKQVRLFLLTIAAMLLSTAAWADYTYNGFCPDNSYCTVACNNPSYYCSVICVPYWHFDCDPVTGNCTPDYIDHYTPICNCTNCILPPGGGGDDPPCLDCPEPVDPGGDS